MPKRRDANHAEIRDALRAVQITVIDTADEGHGKQDMVAVREDGRVFLIEAKMVDGSVTPDEYEFIVKLVNPAYRIFTSVEQAVRSVTGEKG